MDLVKTGGHDIERINKARELVNEVYNELVIAHVDLVLKLGENLSDQVHQDFINEASDEMDEALETAENMRELSFKEASRNKVIIEKDRKAEGPRLGSKEDRDEFFEKKLEISATASQEIAGSEPYRMMNVWGSFQSLTQSSTVRTDLETSTPAASSEESFQKRIPDTESSFPEFSQKFQDEESFKFIEKVSKHEIFWPNRKPALKEGHWDDGDAERKAAAIANEKAADKAAKFRREVEAAATYKRQEKDYNCSSHQSTQGESQAAVNERKEQEEYKVAVEPKAASHVVKFEGNEACELKRSAVKDHELHYIAQDDKESIGIMGEGAVVHTPSSIEFYDPVEKLFDNIISSKGFAKLKLRLLKKSVHNEKGFVSSEVKPAKLRASNTCKFLSPIYEEKTSQLCMQSGLCHPRNYDPVGGAPVGDKYVYSKSARASQFVHDNGKLAQYGVRGAKHPTQQESDTFDLEQQIGDLEQARILAKLKLSETAYVEMCAGSIVLVTKCGFNKKGVGGSNLLVQYAYIVRSYEDVVPHVKDGKLKVSGAVCLKGSTGPSFSSGNKTLQK